MKPSPMLALTFTLPLLAASCGGPSGTTQLPSNTPYVVSGTLFDLNATATNQSQLFTAWTDGAGTVQASNGSIKLMSGSLASGGSFSVGLPGTLPSSDLSALGDSNVDLSTENCVGTLAISNKTALTTAVAFAVQGTTQDGATLPVDLQVTVKTDGSGTVKEVFSTLIYSNATTSLTGKQTCIVKGSQVFTDFNVKLQPGYNVANLVINLAIDSQGKAIGSASYASGSRPSRWIVGDASATPLSLKSRTDSIKTLMQQQVTNLFH